MKLRDAICIAISYPGDYDKHPIHDSADDIKQAKAMLRGLADDCITERSKRRRERSEIAHKMRLAEANEIDLD
jgi:hypothetical protein